MIIPVIAGETSVNFFPEGGSLVMGLPSIVGFTAEDKFGLPRMVSGVLIDQTGRILDTLTTDASGIGKFEFTPVQDSVYLKITNPVGLEQKYPLPWPKTPGSVIRYKGQSNDSARFIITNSEPGMQKSYWICVLNRKIVWSSIESFSGSKSLSIPVYGLNNGIMQVTVFDQNYNVVAERLVRVQNQKDELRIQMERQQYRSRQRVSLLVEYPVNLIRSDLALSVSLANLAYHPYNATFNDAISSKPCGTEYPYDAKDIDPDLLAIVNYPVNWKEILTYGGVQAPYKNQDGLAGIVYDKKDNISPHAKVRITHFPNFRLYETQTDETGSFRVLFGSDIIDYKFLNIDAYDALGKTSLSARVDYSYMEELHNSLFDETMSSEQEKVMDLDKYGEPDLVYDLRYGPGKFRKSGTETRKKYDPYQYANYTDIMDIIQDLQPYRLSDNKIYFYFRNRGDTTNNTEAIIAVNGALKGTNTGALKNIIPSDITNINISNALLDIRKYTPLNFSSVIEITTIQGMSRYKDAHVQTGQGILNTDREFYSPDYAVESSYSADNRKTLYWNPHISLYQGNSVVLTFYTSDVKGTFYGHITGLDKDGNPVEKTFTFIVE